jgi:UDPglucose 6-dehydrogenase
MMENFKIGIIGQGFVGTAIRSGLFKHYQIETYDKYKKELSTCRDIEELCDKSNIVFVCLPTPMFKDGICDLGIVEGVIADLDSLVTPEHIIVLKSTVPPGTTKRLNLKYKDLKIVFSPEFLTEANYIEDFKNQSTIIIGGSRPGSSIVKNMFRKVFRDASIIKTSSDIAEMIKYTSNCFLSTKVSFANEIKQICDNCDIDYDKVVEYVLYDKRLGPTHWSVPGPDGRLGFGGSCFPKDINALINFAKEVGVKPTVLESVWEKNLEVRPEKDWELLKGRAVSEED